MPIEVKHSGSAAPGAVAAYGGGQAKRIAQLAPQIMQAGENRKERQFRAAQDSNRFIQNRELADDQQRRAREDFTYEYTEKQRLESSRIATALEDARKSGAFTPEEFRELEQQATAQQLGINRSLQLKKPNKWGEGQGPGDVWTDPETGERLTRDTKTHNVTSVAKPQNQVGPKEYVDLYKHNINLFTDPITNVVDTEKAQAATDAAFEAMQKRFSKKPADQGGQELSLDQYREASNKAAAKTGGPRSKATVTEIKSQLDGNPPKKGPYDGGIKTREQMMKDFKAEEGRDPTPAELEALKKLEVWN